MIRLILKVVRNKVSNKEAAHSMVISVGVE